MKTNQPFSFMKTALVLFFILNSKAQQIIKNDVVNNSNPNNLNINHFEGKNFQDQKRGVVFIYVIDNEGNTFYGSGFLVNTVSNTFLGVEKQYYILTANHVIPKASEISKLYISFDYELEHQNKRRSSSFITFPIYRIPVLKVSSNIDSDITLLKIDIEPSDVDYPSVNKIFNNAYVLGWTLHPDLGGVNKTNVSHPGGDPKKIFPNAYSIEMKMFKTPSETDALKLYSTDYKFFYSMHANASPEGGSSGSPVFENDSKLVSAVHIANDSKHSISSMLENNWFKKENSFGLMDLLDANKTWVSKVNGGYLNDLIPNESVDFDLEINGESGVNKNMNIDLFFFDNLVDHQKLDNILGAGLAGISGNDNLYLTVTPQNDSNYLLYGAYANENYLSQNTKNLPFNGMAWDSNSPPSADLPVNPNLIESSPPFWCCSSNSISEQSIEFKKVMFDYIKSEIGKSAFETSLKEIIKSSFPVQIKIRKINSSSSPSKIRAFKLPYFMPYNAVEFFQPERFYNLWKSNKYPESRGEISSSLHINNFSIFQNNNNLLNITSGDNGGYLNLVNTNFISKPIFTSFKAAGEEEIPFSINLITNANNTTSELYYRKIWIDFFPVVDANNRYNFVNDPVVHPIEELVSEQSTAFNYMSKEVKMPNNFELGLAPGERRICRLRVAISGEDNITQNGMYSEGEVEDYMVEIVAPTADQALVSTAKIAIQNKNTRISQVALPQGTTSSPTNQNAAQNQLYQPNNSQQSNSLALGFSMTDLGKLPHVFSPVLIPATSIFSQDYSTIGNNSTGNNTLTFDCFNPANPNNDPNLDYQLINFNPNNPNSWSYWQEFTTLYKNLSRIIRFWDNLTQLPQDPFVEDTNDVVNYAIFNEFVNYYNNYIPFKNTINETTSVDDLLYFIYNNPNLLEDAVGQQNFSIYKNIFGFIVKYQCYIQKLIDYQNQFGTALNVTNNQAAVAVDWWGEIIPKNYTERTLVNTITLTQYPATGNMGVIYQDKGDNNLTTISVNSTGNLIFEIKNGTETKNITSTSAVPLNQEIVITTIFDDGKMNMFLNNTFLGSNTLSTNSISNYVNYTNPNNGARWGTPVYNYTNPAENTNKTDIDAELHQFLLFDKALNANEIGILVSGVATNTYQARNELTENSGQKENHNDIDAQPSVFSIFPNPVKDKLSIIVEVKQAGTFKLKINDLSGKKVYEMNKPFIEAGHHFIELQNLNLPASIYILNLKAGDVHRAEKIIIE